MSAAFQVFTIMLLSVFVQSYLGFGSAILAMGLLPAVIGLGLATPLFALVATVFQPFLILYYRRSLDFRAVGRLLLSSLAGIPLGIALLKWAPDTVMLPLLGLVLVGYGLYSLSPLRMPEFRGRLWPYLMGFISGAFGGAYAVSGPPVIVYAAGRRWPASAFKANLTGYFLLNTAAILVGHLFNGSYVPEIWPYFWVCLPAAAIGMAAGLWTGRFTRPEIFEKIVLAGVVVLGLGLVF